MKITVQTGKLSQDIVSAGKEANPKPRCLSRSVLVVDDNKNQVESIAKLLKIVGCEVRGAPDAPSALEALNKIIPEFALIDIGLPGIDGYELARRIRKVDEFNKIVLIAHTGWGRDEDREESRRAGFDYHMTKPLDFQRLETILMGTQPVLRGARMARFDSRQ